MPRPASRNIAQNAVAAGIVVVAAVVASIIAPRPAAAFFCFGFSFDGGGPSVRFGFGDSYGFRSYRYAPHQSPYVMPLPPGPPPPGFAYSPPYGQPWPPPPPPWAFQHWRGPRRW